jgi:hypothetical protein
MTVKTTRNSESLSISNLTRRSLTTSGWLLIIPPLSSDPFPMNPSPGWRRATCALGLILLNQFRPAYGQAITYQTRDLTNSIVGQDRWEISYAVSGYTFPVNHGFSIFFDSSIYGNLEAPPPPVNAGWSVLAVQPDFSLNQPGYYDAQALQNSPSTLDLFSVRFVWTGEGTPASQPFTIYDENFQTTFSGTTTAVPEPGPFALIGVGVAVVLICRKRKSHKCSGGLDASQS